MCGCGTGRTSQRDRIVLTNIVNLLGKAAPLTDPVCLLPLLWEVTQDWLPRQPRQPTALEERVRF